MTIMTWDPCLDVGVTAMNQEHQQILDVMNKLHDAHVAGQSGAAVNDLVGRLGQICVSHFADEEAYMEKVAYAGIGTHKQLHKRLLEQFGEHAKTIAAAGGRTTDEFFQFLKFWLTSHIRGIDMKYSPSAQKAA
jgi:hemerythrin-like metal-binding protein